MTYGLTDTGFVRKTYANVVSDLSAKARQRIASTLRLDEKTFLGNCVAIFAEEADAVWEGLEALAGALDPDNATGPLLTALCKLTGVVREPEQKGTALLDVEFSATRTITAGGLSVSQLGDATNLWINAEEIVGTAGGTVEDVIFQSVAAGSQAYAGAGTLTVIASGGTGVASVTNPADATSGTDTETEDELRIRRERSLAVAGKATTAAIQAEILTGADGESGVPGVQDCRVIENDTDGTVDGVPAHSLHVLIWDDDPPEASNTAIAQAIYDAKAGGVLTYGVVSVSIPDSWGVLKSIRFSRMTGVEITLAVTVTGTTSESVVKAALLTYGASLVQGDDIIWSKLFALAADAEGVEDVTALTIDRGAGPVSTNVSMAVDEKALFDATRITVTIA